MAAREGCCSKLCSFLTCEGPGPHEIYRDRALEGDGRTTFGGEPPWKRKFKYLDVLTAYRPFDIIDFYFQPHSTGVSLAYLVFCFLVLLVYSIDVGVRDNSKFYLVKLRTTSNNIPLPGPSGIGFSNADGEFQDLSSLGLEVQWFVQQRKREVQGDAAFINTTAQQLPESRNCFTLFTCPEGGVLDLSRARALTEGRPWREVIGEVVVTDSGLFSASEATYMSGFMTVRLQRYDEFGSFDDILAEGFEELTLPNSGNRSLANHVLVLYSPIILELESRLFFFGESKETTMVYSGHYNTPSQRTSTAVGTVVFSVRIQLEDAEFQAQVVNEFFLENLGTICGLLVILYLFGGLFRMYNRWHFHNYGKFKEGSMDPIYLKNHLRQDNKYVPPGIREMRDENLTDKEALKTALNKQLKLAEQVRNLLTRVLVASAELKEDSKGNDSEFINGNRNERHYSQDLRRSSSGVLADEKAAS